MKACLLAFLLYSNSARIELSNQNIMKNPKTLTRRTFLSTTATASLVAPAILSAKKSQSGPLVIGEGEHRYEVHHNWAKLPDKFTWQTTHNVAVDKAGNLYVIHEGRRNLKDHPSIFVFDPNGKFIRAFGNQFQGGGLGLEVRQEGNEEFLYVCAYQNVKAFAKLTLKGETVWEKYAPMDSGVYRKGEDGSEAVRFKGQGRPRWGRDAFLPTNFAFLDDGGFLLADGYGRLGTREPLRPVDAHQRHVRSVDEDRLWDAQRTSGRGAPRAPGRAPQPVVDRGGL